MGQRKETSQQQRARGNVLEQWGAPMYLVMSVFGVTSWDIPLQPSGVQIFPFWEGSSLQGPRALAQIPAGL